MDNGDVAFCVRRRVETFYPVEDSRRGRIESKALGQGVCGIAVKRLLTQGLVSFDEPVHLCASFVRRASRRRQVLEFEARFVGREHIYPFVTILVALGEDGPLRHGL